MRKVKKNSEAIIKKIDSSVLGFIIKFFPIIDRIVAEEVAPDTWKKIYLIQVLSEIVFFK